ncbi:MAG TPA: chloride channel protein [Bacteroidales bacterium]|nr:chloride channel protein [Bacteroidales bacterium]HSA43755.1 chloride channel protein [Bacteroidales bacterium]
MNFQNITGRLQAFRNRRLSHRRLVLVLSICTGLLAGIAAVILKNAVHYLGVFLTGEISFLRFNFLILLYPLIGIIIVYLLTRYWFKQDIRHGISRILLAISQHRGKLGLRDTVNSMAGSTLTIGFGGSVGLEAPIVLSGSAIGSSLGQLFRLEYKYIVLLIGCGAAGAIAGIFKAPIAGVVFALEVLMLDLTMASLIPLLISAITGATLAALLMGKEVLFSITLTESYRFTEIPYFIVLGVMAGFISLYFSRANHWIEGLFSRTGTPLKRAVAGGLILSILVFLFPPLFGEGYLWLADLLRGQGDKLLSGSLFQDVLPGSWTFLLILFVIVLLKVVAMSVTTGAGGVGGVFAPTLFVGGMTGFFFAGVVNLTRLGNLSEKNFSLVGMAGLMAGVMHAPLTAIFLIAEMTDGYELLIPLMITATIAYLTINYFEPHSVYAKRLAEAGKLISRNRDKAVLSQLRIDNLIETNFNTVNIRGYLGDLVKEVAKSQRNVFPVVDKENNFQGVVFINDVREILFKPELYGRVLISDLMYMPDPVVQLGESMEEVARKFHDTENYNLPVLDHGKYVGFVSRANVFSAYREMIRESSEE